MAPIGVGFHRFGSGLRNGLCNLPTGQTRLTDECDLKQKHFRPTAKPVNAQAETLQPSGTNGLLKRMSLLAAIVIGAGVLFVAVGVFLFKTDAYVGVLAVCVCTVATLLAHLFADVPKGDEYILLRLALGMFVRTGLPLLVAVWALYFADPPLEKSLVFYIILLYLVGLVADVLLNVNRLKQQA